MNEFHNYIQHVYDGPASVEVGINSITDGDVVAVEATAWINGVDLYKVSASSRRDPHDPCNPEIGVKLAVGRALRQLGREILKEGQDGVRRQDKARRTQELASQEARNRKEKRRKAAIRSLKNKG